MRNRTPPLACPWTSLRLKRRWLRVARPGLPSSDPARRLAGVLGRELRAHDAPVPFGRVHDALIDTSGNVLALLVEPAGAPCLVALPSPLGDDRTVESGACLVIPQGTAEIAALVIPEVERLAKPLS